MSARRVGAVMVLALSGCGASFSSLGDFTMSVVSWSAELEYDDQAMGCQTMASDFAATMDQQPAHGVVRGGTELNSLGGETRCQHPLIAFNMPPMLGEISVLEATAGGEKVEVRILGMSQFVGGQVMLAQGQVVHPGDRLSIQLGPLFQRLSWPVKGTAMVREAGGATGDLAVAAPSTTGVMEVTLPASLPAGFTELQVYASTTPDITGCDGAPACRWGGGEIHPVLNASVQVAP